MRSSSPSASWYICAQTGGVSEQALHHRDVNPSKRQLAMDITKAGGLRRLDLETGALAEYCRGERLLLSSQKSGRLIFEHRRSTSIQDVSGAFVEHVVGMHMLSGLHAEMTYDGCRALEYCSARGDISLIPAFHPYRARTRGTFEGIVVALSPTIFSEASLGTARASRIAMKPSPGRADPVTAQLLSSLHANVLVGMPPDPLFFDAIGVALAAHLSRMYGEVDLTTSSRLLPRRRLDLLKNYINAHLEESLSLKELASLLSMDMFSFVRAFRRTTGVTPHQYLIDARVEAARRLLTESRLAIAQVALRCGFSSQSHLGSVLMKKYGVTPAVVRRTSSEATGPTNCT